MLWLREPSVNIVLIAAGGALGSVARYGLSSLVQRLVPTAFPLGTFAVNVAGCLVLGTIVGAAAGHRVTVSPQARAFVLIGLLGGFTTFSAFTYETYTLLHEGLVVRALVNTVGQVVLSLLALWGGYTLATSI